MDPTDRLARGAQVALELDAALVVAAEIQAGTWDARYAIEPAERRAFALGYLESAIRGAVRELRA